MTMEFKSGLTTWVMQCGKASFGWRWNMTLHDALRTCCYKRFERRRHYMAVGPLIVEWEG